MWAVSDASSHIAVGATVPPAFVSSKANTPAGTMEMTIIKERRITCIPDVIVLFI